jgi:hypothetical protein
MPTLNHITCTVQLANALDDSVPEYATAYGNGIVSAYIAVPQHRTWFEIHLESDGYVAPGLAAFVYVDGTYVGNKNTVSLSQTEEHQLQLVFDGFEELSDDGGNVTRRGWWFEEFIVGEFLDQRRRPRTDVYQSKRRAACICQRRCSTTWG